MTSRSVVGFTLGSSHAPLAGTEIGETPRRYSDAWHMCDPANWAAQAACIAGRPFMAAFALVKPATVTFGAPLQQARGRAVEQLTPTPMPPLDCSWVPLVALLVQFRQV